MISRKAIGHTIFLLLAVFSFAQSQKITLEELQTICNNKNFEATNRLLLSKNFEFSRTEKTDDKANIISWSMDKISSDGSIVTSTLSTHSTDGVTSKAIFKFRNKDIYAVISAEIQRFGYKPENDEIEDGNIISNYSNKNFIIKLSFKKISEQAESNAPAHTAYEVEIIRKGNVDDPGNGVKTDFHENGKVKMEYSLQDGKLHGAIKYYTPEGHLQKKGIMQLGLENGVFTEYAFDDDSKKPVLKESGSYVIGKRKGQWESSAILDDREINIGKTTFVDGIKEGVFSKISYDSISFGSYKNNIINGKYTVFTTEKNIENGVLVEIDTLKLKKVITGFYADNNKHGEWNYFDVDGTKIMEGKFENNKKVGKWKRFYSIYVDDNDKEMDYSGTLFLEENYVDGKLNGETKRFSTLKDVNFPCTDDSNKICTKVVFTKILEKSNFENGLLNGAYELINSENQLVKKGQYTAGKKTGKWILLNNCTVVAEHNNTEESGEFLNDKKHGKWERRKNDKIISSYTYENDIIDGDHVCYENQKITEKRNFAAGKLKVLELFNEVEQPSIKYTITENEQNYNCEKTEYLKDGVCVKNYLVSKKQDSRINYMTFKNDFEKSDKIADGWYQKKTVDNQIYEEGNFKNNLKHGKWTNFYYDKKVKTEIDYNEKAEVISEFYTDLKKNAPFSGEFEMVYVDKSGSEERKIKEGKRNGTTRYKDAKDKTSKKESYKDGVLKVED